MPKASVFAPETPQGEPVILSIEEYECVRLIDRVGLTQEECADFMQVSRTTAQQIYQDARKKLAFMLVDSRPLKIEGGTYEICGQDAKHCCGRCCCREKAREEEV